MQQLVKIIRVAFVLSISSMRAWGSRSIVIIISIALGISSVLLTRGMLRAMDNEQMRIMNGNGGITTIWVEKERARTPKNKVMFGRSPGLLPRQIEWACKNIPGIAFSVPRVSFTKNISCGNVSFREYGLAVNTHYSTTYVKSALLDGRFVTQTEYENADQVCLLGQRFREQFFGETGQWKGKKISIDGVLFEVVGILGGNYDWTYHLTLTAYWNNFASHGTSLPQCEFMCDDTSSIRSVEASLNEYLLKEHRGIKDFNISNALELRQELINNQKTGRIITIGMGMLALALAIIGIVNVFLAVLNERIREIGVYKALGSSNAIVFFQFFLESVLLALAGGTLGVLIGNLLLNLPFLPWKGVVLPADYVITIGSAIAAGLMAGLLPAVVAARFSPARSIGHFA